MLGEFTSTPAVPPMTIRRLGGYRRRNKFGTSDPTQRTYASKIYHSAAEAKYAEQLDWRMKAGPRHVDGIKSWKSQVPVKLEVNGSLITTYIMDFVIEHFDGHLEWVEIKGYPTAEWLIKKKLFMALYPERRYTIISARSIR